jgi:hypothetical protein
VVFVGVLAGGVGSRCVRWWRWSIGRPSSVIEWAARNHPAAATILLRCALAAVALGLLEEGGEGAALLLSLRRCIEGGERV